MGLVSASDSGYLLQQGLQVELFVHAERDVLPGGETTAPEVQTDHFVAIGQQGIFDVVALQPTARVAMQVDDRAQGGLDGSRGGGGRRGDEAEVGAL